MTTKISGWTEGFADAMRQFQVLSNIMLEALDRKNEEILRLEMEIRELKQMNEIHRVKKQSSAPDAVTA